MQEPCASLLNPHLFLNGVWCGVSQAFEWRCGMCSVLCVLGPGWPCSLGRTVNRCALDGAGTFG